jgi:hypothetical protein
VGPRCRAGFLAESWRHARSSGSAQARLGLLAESRRYAESSSGAHPPSRATGGVAETHRVKWRRPAPKRGFWWSRGDTASQVVAPNPQVGLLVESWRHVGSSGGAQLPSRVTGGVMATRRVKWRRPALEQGRWRSRGDTPSQIAAPNP